MANLDVLLPRVGSNQAARRQMAADGSRPANRKSTESSELATPSAARIWDEFEPSISARVRLPESVSANKFYIHVILRSRLVHEMHVRGQCGC